MKRRPPRSKQSRSSAASDVYKRQEIASDIDDILEQSLEYAYSENWGYLTSCPTNVGTGMRASVMVHLPALNITGNMNKILQTVAHIGLTIRGLYGEGTEIVGNIFQISNQITLGRAEEEIVCLLYTSPSPRDRTRSRMPSSA